MDSLYSVWGVSGCSRMWTLKFNYELSYIRYQNQLGYVTWDNLQESWWVKHEIRGWNDGTKCSLLALGCCFIFVIVYITIGFIFTPQDRSFVNAVGFFGLFVLAVTLTLSIRFVEDGFQLRKVFYVTMLFCDSVPCVFLL